MRSVKSSLFIAVAVTGLTGVALLGISSRLLSLSSQANSKVNAGAAAGAARAHR